jgi:hypothetical protein
MKSILLIFLLSITYTIANAQSTAKPMVMVYTHRQPNGIIIDVDSMGKINPKFIKAINVLKDSTSTSKYGNAAKGGVIQVYLDDEKYPDAYKLLMKKDSIKSIKQ